MFTIYAIIINCGDGSNTIDWVDNETVFQELEHMASQGYESVASGDGLQSQKFRFSSLQSLKEFIDLNNIEFLTMDNVEYLRY